MAEGLSRTVWGGRGQKWKTKVPRLPKILTLILGLVPALYLGLGVWYGQGQQIVGSL